MTHPPGRSLFSDAPEPEPEPTAPEPAERPRSRTGRRLTLTVLAVGVAAFLVTGLLAPGFLLPADDDGQTPEEFAGKLLTALESRDITALNGLKCSTAEPDVEAEIASTDSVTYLTMDSVRIASETEAMLSAHGRFGGAPINVRSRLLNSGGEWCWQDFTKVEQEYMEGGTETSPAPSAGADNITEDPAATARTFVDALNAKDARAAGSVACGNADDQLQTAVGKMTAGQPALTLGEQSGLGFVIEGTLEGAPIRGMVVVRDGCIHTLTLS